MTKTKTSSRDRGCLSRRRLCPCGDPHCYIRLEGDEEITHMDTVGSSEQDQHSTPQNSSEVTLVDLTPYVGQSFQSDEDAEEFYCNFARKNGFAIRRERSKGSQEHPLGVYRRELVCYRAGNPRPRKTADLKRQRNKVSSRCNCEAQMVIKKDIGAGVTRWVVVQFSNVHNHDLLDSNEVRYLPAYRNISTVDRERILSLSKAGCNVSFIMRALETEKGLKPNTLTFTGRDLRNFINLSKNINQESEECELLNACKDMKDKNPSFCFEYTLDDNNKLQHIAWSYGESISAYKVFGDVVVFDTTYHLYSCNRPLGVWLGVDNHGHTIFFGCVILQDGASHSFTWALQSFLQLMNGKYPQTVLIDQDLELMNAMLIEWPHIKLAFSIWHVMSKLPSWFSVLLGYQYEKLKSEFHRLFYLDAMEEFEYQWAQMVIEFGLSSDRHIDLLFNHRTFWALPYLRGSFFAGLMTIGASISIGSFFKEFLTSKTHLKDFVGQVYLAVDFQNQAAEAAAVRQKYETVKIKTCMPMEEKASAILTPYAFNMLQNEILSSVNYAVFEVSDDGWLVRHHMKADGGHIVRWTRLDENVHCICKQFESTGILCGHAIRVLSQKNCFVLPDKYLPTRWRRESSFLKGRSNNYHSQTLGTLATILIQESTMTRERFSHVQVQMDRLLMHVRCMPTANGTALSSPTISIDDTMDGTPTVDLAPSDGHINGPSDLTGSATKVRKRMKRKVEMGTGIENANETSGRSEIGNETSTVAETEKETLAVVMGNETWTGVEIEKGTSALS